MRRMTTTMMMSEHQDDDQTRVFYDLCSMIIHIFRSPPPLLPLPFLNTFSVSSSSSSSSSPIFSHLSSSSSSPSAFASLFLGISIAMMLFGSVTFLIGLILLPWVVGLVFLFYLAGIISNLSELGRSFLCPATTSFKDFPAWEL